MDIYISIHIDGRQQIGRVASEGFPNIETNGSRAMHISVWKGCYSNNRIEFNRVQICDRFVWTMD